MPSYTSTDLEQVQKKNEAKKTYTWTLSYGNGTKMKNAQVLKIPEFNGASRNIITVREKITLIRLSVSVELPSLKRSHWCLRFSSIV